MVIDRKKVEIERNLEIGRRSYFYYIWWFIGFSVGFVSFFCWFRIGCVEFLFCCFEGVLMGGLLCFCLEFLFCCFEWVLVGGLLCFCLCELSLVFGWEFGDLDYLFGGDGLWLDFLVRSVVFYGCECLDEVRCLVLVKWIEFVSSSYVIKLYLVLFICFMSCNCYWLWIFFCLKILLWKYFFV